MPKAVQLAARGLIGVGRAEPLQVDRLRRFEARAEFGKRHMPRQVGFAAVTATVEEAADAAERQSDCHARCDQVGHRQERQAVLQDEDDEPERGADQAAVDDEPAFGILAISRTGATMPRWRAGTARSAPGCCCCPAGGVWRWPGRLPSLWLMLLFAIGAVAMRGAGCTVNDLTDRDFDRQVARTRNRPLASGRLGTREALLFIAAQCLVGLLVLAALNRTAALVALRQRAADRRLSRS